MPPANLGGRFSFDWYLHPHPRPSPLLRLRPNPASMRLDQRLGDGETQSRGRAIRVRPRFIGAVEAVEDVGQVGGWNTFSGIRDCN